MEICLAQTKTDLMYYTCANNQCSIHTKICLALIGLKPVLESNRLLKRAKLLNFLYLLVYRVTDEDLIAETSVWPNCS